MSEPLDNNSVRFYLDFITGSEGLKEISEPVSFDGANFVLKQDSGRYGIDVSFSGGDIDLEFWNKTFTNGLTHEFKLIQIYFRRYGFESEIKFIVESSGLFTVIGDLDFDKCITDQLEFFKCKIIQVNEQAIIKRRKKIKVNIFSSKDLDGNNIDPVKSDVILLEAKPIDKITEYRLGAEGAELNNFGSFANYNPYNGLVSAELEKSMYPLYNYAFNSYLTERMSLVDVEKGLTNIFVKIKDVRLNFYLPLGASLTNAELILRFYIGNVIYDPLNQKGEVDIKPFLIYQGVKNVDFGDISGDAEHYTALVNTEISGGYNAVSGNKIWVFFDFKNLNMPSFLSALEFKQSEGSITISADSTDVSTITRSIRLIDAIKQVCKSIGNFDVISPRFDEGGEFYEQRIFDGNLLRGFKDKPFYISFEDITKQLREVNGDYVITSDGKIFIGLYGDYHTDNKMAEFTMLPNDSFEKSFNERYSINKISYRYKSFQENRDEKNTLESVHTNTQWSLPNKQVENEIEIEIPFIRDTFLLESTRIQSIEVKKTTSLSQDNKIFIVETISSQSNFVFQEVLQLFHSFSENNDLKILNDGSFSWERMGIQVTDPNDFSSFSLNNVNSENYSIIEVKDYLLTIRPSNQLPLQEVGMHSTSFNYTLLSTNIKNRTNEGFIEIKGIKNTNGYSNLNYTIKRNLLNYWGDYINTCVNYKRDLIIKNTFFKNNKLLSTLKTNETTPIVEGNDIIIENLKDRILTPVFYKTQVLADLSQVINLMNDCRDVRGYILLKDNRGEKIKVHPTLLDFNWNENILTIEGEERFNIIDFLTIVCNSGIITISQVGFEDIVTEFINYDIEGDNILLYDENMLNLTYPINYANVSVNGQKGDTPSHVANLIDGICM